MDDVTLTKLAAEHSPELSRLCVGLCKNIPDAEDLFQDTWLRVMKYYHKYDPGQPFDKWLYAVCVNTFKSRVTLFSVKKAVNFASTEEKEEFLQKTAVAQNFDYEHFEVMSLLQKLPKKLKTVVTLKYFGDYTEKDVADMLHIPQGTVKSRLNRAKKLLLEALGDER